jgi:hypothetical protein
MGQIDLTTILVIFVAFLVGYGGVSWILSIARKGLAPKDYRRDLPPREKFGDRPASLPPPPADDTPRGPRDRSG